MAAKLAEKSAPEAARRPQLTDAERRMLRGTWPLDLIEDPKRQPRYLETAEEFIRELLTGEHVEDFMILPDGVDLLDLSWEDSIPKDLRECLSDCRNVGDFIRRLKDEPDVINKYRADIEYLDAKKQQKSILRKDKRDLGKRVNEALRMVDAGEADPNLMYIAELRLRNEIQHPIGGDRAKTVCERDVKDVLGPYSKWTLYWDRYDEGFFAGGRYSGKGVHIDQVLWSNVGRNWQGYKLVAAWPKGDVSKEVATNFYDVLFKPPITEHDLSALRQTAIVALLRPGDVYMFSGGIAHTVLCVSEDMCFGAYESFVNLHPSHVEHFLHTDDKEGPFCLETYSMTSKELHDTEDDCIDQLEDAADHLNTGGPAKNDGSQGARFACWSRLREGLHADEPFQAMLRKHYGKAVELCLGKRYFMRNIPRKVVFAAEGCGAGVDDESVAAKRRRVESPSPSEHTDGNSA